MSKVVIAGDASGTGTFTISAPNGNTDRTLVLPDVSGSVVTTGDTNTVSAEMLATTLDLSASTLTLPPANAAMTRLVSGTISSSTASLDIDLSAYSYTCYKLFIRNIQMTSDTQVWISKLSSSGVAGGTWYGGATREGEGANAQVNYSGQPHWYLFGDTTTITVSGGAYNGTVDATLMLSGTSNKWTGVANCVFRISGGRTQNINTGAIDINTNALWGLRFAGGANIATLSYAVYGVNMP